MNDPIDLGHGFSYSFVGWHPDRDLNPQYEGIPDVDRAGIIIWCDGQAVGGPMFDLPEVRAIPGLKDRNFWTVESWDPLTISPSIQMYEYRDGQHVPSHHGFIREGKWVPA